MVQPQDLGFTVGVAAGGVALLLFLFVGYPAGRRVIAIGGRARSVAASAHQDEQRILAIAQRILNRVGVTVLVLLTVAAAAMATARYWPLVL